MVKLSLRVFINESGDTNFDINSCIISNKHCNLPSNALIKILNSVTLVYPFKDNIVLIVNKSDCIDEGDIILHRWVLEVLHIELYSIIEISELDCANISDNTTSSLTSSSTIISLSQSLNHYSIELKFISFFNEKHWDEVSFLSNLSNENNSNGSIELPFMWSSIWPVKLSKETFESNCCFLLFGSILCHRSLIAIKYMDIVMVSTKCWL